MPDILTKQDGPILRVTLNQPERGNAVSDQMVAALTTIIEGADKSSSVVVLRAGIEESVPTKIYDAFAVGCPVVLSAGGEARRMLESAGAALCVAPGDARALANALERLAGDARLAAELRANGRRLAAEVGTREAVMAELAARMHAAMGDVARVS